jgi:hypothetical protein
MLQTDRSVAIPTGMIIAALYVILLIGFSRESYMRRDAASLDASRVDVAREKPMADDTQICRIGQPVCSTPLEETSDAQNCLVPLDALRDLVGGTQTPLTLDRLRRALGAASP